MYPILFTVYNISFHVFGIFLGLAFFFGFFFAKKIARHKKLNPEFFSKNFILFVLVFLFFGRLFYLLCNLDLYTDNLKASFSISDGGFSFLAAWSFSTLFLYLLCRIFRQNFWTWFDVFFIAFLSSMFFVEIGRFFSGSTFGNETSLPWGMIFESATLGFIVPLHPVQIYSAILLLVIFLVFYPQIKMGLREGTFSALGISILGFALFMNSFFRGDENTIFFFLNLSHILSLAFFIFGLGRLFSISNKRKKIIERREQK